MKKALILFPCDSMGGAERVTRTVAYAAASSRNFDEVICFVLSRRSTGTLDKLAKLSGVKLIYTNSTRILYGLVKLIDLFRVEQFEFTFCSFADLNAILSLSRKLGLLKTSLLITRESTMLFDRNFGWKTLIARRLYYFYGGQDLIICQTERMKESLNKNTNHRFRNITTVIPNPLDFEAISPPDLSDKKLYHIPVSRIKIIWCGRLSHVKSPLRAIDTLFELHKTGYTNYQLVMVGDGVMLNEVKTRIDNYRLTEFVTLTGFHPYPIILMKQCSLGLITSDVEGFPNVIIEMLYAGVKGVVSTDCAGGLREMPGVYLVKESDAYQLSRGLIALTSNLDKPEKKFQHMTPKDFLLRIMNHEMLLHKC